MIERLKKDYVCVWKNIRPSEAFRDGMYSAQRTEELKKLPAGTGDNNVCVHVATAEGRILHSVQGFADADALLDELDFAKRASTTEESQLAELYRARYETMKDKRSTKANGQALLAVNLRILSEGVLPSLDKILKSETAGLDVLVGKSRRK